MSPRQGRRNSHQLDGDEVLAGIEVPLLYIGAAGGYGEHGLYSTTASPRAMSRHSSFESSRRSRSPPTSATGDLLFALDAPELVWEPLVRWLLAH